ncbi:MAG: hypothetical protein ACKV2O_02555 [Acidimicrobiales bacterium]
MQSGCGRDTAAATVTTRPAAVQELPTQVQGFKASIGDEVVPVSGGKIRWETRWQLCWDVYPAATAYELQVVTSEGSSTKSTRQSDPCVSLQIAAGENDAAQGMLNRDLIVATTAGHVGYRVRAILGEDTVSSWSAPYFAGDVTAAGP